ncbi:MAG: response regulator [Clostridium sp.]|nr:response regulator [Clostridium sp.]MCM1444071.1 response regulator [Candidatus Amulumruptor caecigallinarius]
MKMILLVDDDISFLKILTYSLNDKKNNIITASCVEEAIDKINNVKFDLIISDYNMGNDNGLSILKNLRNNNDNAKFIMLTGNDSSELQYMVEQQDGIFLDKGNLNLLKKIKEEISKL